MSRKYVKSDEYGKQILEMKAQEKTNRAIAQTLHLAMKSVKKKVAGSCTSTATRGSNTPHKHIST